MTDDELIEWAAKLDTDTCKAFYVFRMAKAMSLTSNPGMQKSACTRMINAAKELREIIYGREEATKLDAGNGIL